MTDTTPNLPAFPQHVAFNSNGEAVTAGLYFAEGPGMTIRQYAAIHLCVPDSGLPWLDEIIQKSLRDRFASQEKIDPNEEMGWPLLEALAGPRPSGNWNSNPMEWFNWSNKWQAAVRYARADAMMERRGK